LLWEPRRLTTVWVSAGSLYLQFDANSAVRRL
jgi:hypothetical protein